VKGQMAQLNCKCPSMQRRFQRISRCVYRYLM